ncbi:MAG TPA: hypothetical protein VIN77_04650, partial [Aurantimonas sp.]
STICGIALSRDKKLLASIRQNPNDVRFEDALRAAALIGFERKGGEGSHQTFAREGEATQLNFQNTKNGKAKPYQVRQLITMMDVYEE